MDVNEILKYRRKPEDDYYAILGCDDNATTDQITAEYRILALDLHPDKNPDDPIAVDRFQKIQKARDILTDADSRDSYDKWRNSGIAMSFEQWMSYNKSMHTSLHWAAKKKEYMIECSTEEQSTSASDMRCQSSQIDQPLLVHIESESRVAKGTERKPGNGMHWVNPNIPWQRAPPNSETLRKFRNYEI